MITLRTYDPMYAKPRLPATAIADTVVNLIHVEDGKLTIIATFVRAATDSGIYYTMLTIQPKRPADGYVSPSLGYRKAVGKGGKYESKWYSLLYALRDCGIVTDAEDAFVTIFDAASVIKNYICEYDGVDPNNLYIIETNF